MSVLLMVVSCFPAVKNSNNSVKQQIWIMWSYCTFVGGKNPTP